jgi:hypothetical protein
MTPVGHNEAMGAVGEERGQWRGFALLDALASLALLGLLAVGSLSLLGGGARIAREAAHVDRAIGAVRSCTARLAVRTFEELPLHFGAEDGDQLAALDTADGTAPEEWDALVEELPGGQLRAELRGLEQGGGATAFEDAVALRLTVVAAWDAIEGVRREVTLVETRL